MSTLLILFVKSPKRGETKTRLAADIGHERALEIYQALLENLRRVVLSVPHDVVVFYGNKIPDDDLWARGGFSRYPQSGADLGLRMHNAIDWGFAQGYERVVLIGSDCPDMSAAVINQAFGALKTHDCVLTPAHDGGYVLVGLRESFAPLFTDKVWSTSQVLDDAVQALKAHEKSYHLTAPLGDVDVIQDLEGTWLEMMLT